MTSQKHVLTQEKYDDLKREYEVLTTQKRRQIAESLEYAKSLGDLSENAEYHEARAEQAEVESRIKMIEHLLKYASVISHTSSEVVEIGSTVTLKKKSAQTTITYTIVGSEESDIVKGFISYHSPIGQALIGKSKGDTVAITVPAGVLEYKVVEVK